MSSYILMIMLLFSASPIEQNTVDYVDVIEINHYYGNEGRLTFTQSIFYEWNPISRRYDVLAWRLVKSPENPQINWKKQYYEYTYIFPDGDKETREIRSNQVRVTHTLYDPEMLEREYLERENRKGLSRKISRKSLYLGEKNASENW